MYQHFKCKNINITPVVLDAIFPIENIYKESPVNRFRSNAVIALALTHHLVLSQGIRLEAIFEIFSRYSSRFVLVEFMPLGLWDGVTAPPLPHYYNQEWFSACFQRHFRIILVEKLEENRVLFVGEKLHGNDV